MSCCSEHPDAGKPGADPTAAATETQRKFTDFSKSAAAPGALDARTKQAVAIALIGDGQVRALCQDPHQEGPRHGIFSRGN